MSTLIDDLIKDEHCITGEIGGKWYISKSLECGCVKCFWRRIRDAWKVVRGKAIAVHYKEDATK